MLTGIFSTLAINPWTAYDPINLPKMFVLSTGAAFLLGWLLADFKSINRVNRILSIFSATFVTSYLISFFINPAPTYQQFWGVWGRSTGLLTYLAFIVLMLSAAMISSTT